MKVIAHLRRLAVLAVISVLTFNNSVQAQQSSGAGAANTTVKIAVIDMGEVRQKAKVFKGISDQMNNYASKFESQIKSEEQALRTAEQELARQRTILAAEAFNMERQKFGQRVEALQRKGDYLKRELNRVHNQAMVEAQTALNKVVTAAADEFKFTLILAKDLTVLSAKSHEVTTMIIERLDKALPAVKVQEPRSEPPAEGSGAPRPGTPGLSTPAR